MTSIKSLIAFATFLFCTLASNNVLQAAEPPAFPGAQGFGASTPGGRGGKILRVTTLKADGPGSLTEALRTKGPRIIVFEVGGIIDLGGRSLKLSEPFVTIAGQTAPAPGITLIKGGLGISTHDVIIRHIAIRPGSMGRKKKSGWEVDGMSGIGAHHVIVDHCSCTWATDENLSASGDRFKGKTPEEWRAGTSHHITLSNCIIAEGLSNSTHGKGEHSKGTLLHDNTQFISLIGNLYASNMERSPLIKGGAHAVIVNNWISNPGRHAMHVNLSEGEWKGHEWLAAQVAVVGNLLEGGPSTKPDVALLKRHGKTPMDLFMEDNIALDSAGKKADLTKEIELSPQQKRPLWPEGLKPIPVAQVKARVAKNAGARPWNRDPIDQRIVTTALEGRGAIIDSEEQAGGYPVRPATTAAFQPEQWDLDTMEAAKNSR